MLPEGFAEESVNASIGMVKDECDESSDLSRKTR